MSRWVRCAAVLAFVVPAACVVSPVVTAASPPTWVTNSTIDATHHPILRAVSCWSAGNCVAVGSVLQAGSGHETPYLIEQSAGVWQARGTVLRQPSTADSARLTAVSCPAANRCVAGGVIIHKTNSNAYGYLGIAPIVLRQRTVNGTWPSAPSVPPGISSTAITPIFDDQSPVVVACADAGDCVIGGAYRDDTNMTWGIGWAWDEQAGHWDASASPTAFGANFVLAGLACPAPGACVAVGIGGGGAAVEQQVSGTWPGGSIALSGPAGTYNPYLNSVSCVDSLDCVAVGTSPLSGGGFTPVTASMTNGVWDQALSSLGASWAASQTHAPALACWVGTSCVAAGYYLSGQQSSVERGFLLLHTSQNVWSTAPTRVAKGLSNVACTTSGDCMAISTDGVAPKTVWVSRGGTTWVYAPAALLPRNLIVGGVSCTQHTACIAVGTSPSGAWSLTWRP